MSSEGLVLEKILSTGSTGIKKSDLKREFTSFDLDQTLENLVNDGKVCVDKKGSAYYCWTSEVYLKHLNNVDPKFRIIIDRIKLVERKLDSQSNSVKDAINNLIELLKMENPESQKVLVNLDNFKIEFDIILSRSNDSIGWIELVQVRNELSQKFDLSKNEFYELVEQLVNAYQNEYELSTGGTEGVTLRGLLHGYVRGI
jgi:chromosome condensin MukBEF complex kleisin-like MukF subunit